MLLPIYAEVRKTHSPGILSSEPAATQTINLSNMTPGIYLLKTTKGNGVEDIQKLIKE
ncbi:T9SS type A sorting domain-containing protein [Chitinophagaceae bacterium MMS25-I14]